MSGVAARSHTQDGCSRHIDDEAGGQMRYPMSLLQKQGAASPLTQYGTAAVPGRSTKFLLYGTVDEISRAMNIRSGPMVVKFARQRFLPSN